MSSYYSSAFSIEERRLSGILDKCREELAEASEKVKKQRLKNEEQKQARKVRDANYEGEVKKTVHSKANRKVEQKIIESGQREQLGLRLRRIGETIQLFEREHDIKLQASGRQKRLEEWIENDDVPLLEMEKRVKEHQEKAENEIHYFREMVKEKKQLSPGKRTASRLNREVSLRIENDTSYDEETVGTRFSRKLKAVMERPGSESIPEFKELEEKLLHTPGSHREVFAAMHMDELEALVKEFDSQEAEREKQSTEIEVFTERYLAYCLLLKEPPDPTILSRQVSIHALKQVVQKKEKQYQTMRLTQYMQDAIVTILKRHGIIFAGTVEAPHGDVQRFDSGDIELEVSGTEHELFTMQMFGHYSGETPTLDEKRKGLAEGVRICGIMETIMQELHEEYGIVFETIAVEEPQEKTFRMRKVKKSESHKYYEKKYISDVCE